MRRPTVYGIHSGRPMLISNSKWNYFLVLIAESKLHVFYKKHVYKKHGVENWQKIKALLRNIGRLFKQQLEKTAYKRKLSTKLKKKIVKA